MTQPLPGAPQVVTPAAHAAFAAAEAAWYEANGTAYHRLIEAWGHKLAQDMWAAALEWAAQQARTHAAYATKCSKGRRTEAPRRMCLSHPKRQVPVRQPAAPGRRRVVIGRTYLERGSPVTVLTRWSGKGPRNVLIERADGTKVVRPFRGLRKPRQGGEGGTSG